MCDYRLKLRLVDLARQKLRFVGNEVVEAGSHARNRRAVVIDHSEAKTDGEQEVREVVELEGLLAACGGQSRLRAVPDDEDCGEHAEKVLSHGVEEVEILREQVVDCLKDVLQEVILHGSAPSTWDHSLRTLRHAEVLQRIGECAGDLGHISGQAGLPRNIGVYGAGGGIALLLGDDGLLFEKGRKEFVRILKRA